MLRKKMMESIQSYQDSLEFNILKQAAAEKAASTSQSAPLVSSNHNYNILSNTNIARRSSI